MERRARVSRLIAVWVYLCKRGLQNSGHVQASSWIVVVDFLFIFEYLFYLKNLL
jgi:hypothetical protein